jgi:hypothetical protein
MILRVLLYLAIAVWLIAAVGLWLIERRQQSAKPGMRACVIEFGEALAWPFHVPLIIRWVRDLLS